MKVRALSPSGDMQWGQGLANFYINSAQGVGQKVLTRLNLFLGEWYLDQSQGTPWFQDILTYNTQTARDLIIKSVILGTPNVNSIISFSSSYNSVTRNYSVTSEIDTTFGTTTISTILTIPANNQ